MAATTSGSAARGGAPLRIVHAPPTFSTTTSAPVCGPPFTGISGTPVREMDYTLDLTGNWSSYLTKTGNDTGGNDTGTHLVFAE